jgi:hypothetical protein
MILKITVGAASLVFGVAAGWYVTGIIGGLIVATIR